MRAPIFTVGEDKRRRFGEVTKEKTTIKLTTHRRKMFLDTGVPRKQAKFLKNASEGVNP